jgi:inner membrane transporter RhtA
VERGGAAPEPRASGPLDAVPPVALVLVAVGSVQFGGALAKTLFDDVGPGGAVLLRIAFATVVLWLLWRPSPAGHTRRDLWLAAAYGVSLAGMNYAFYLALDRIPLGIAVTLEFVGPLGVAVALSRRTLDAVWVVLAAAGILLLADPSGAGGVEAAGAALAVLAGAFWAAYILIAARVGRAFPGGSGLALALAVSTALLLPVGVADGGGDLLGLEVLGVGAAVALLSSAIPYSLELEALRRLPARVFGVLMSLEPAMAAIAGFVVLSQDLVTREVIAIALVVAASAGAARGARADAQPRD